MRSHPHDKQEASPAPPRRDFLGFFKSVVEFFTGVTGMAAAALSILGTVVAFALAGSAPGEDGGGPVGNPTETPTTTPTSVVGDPTATPTTTPTVVPDDWAEAVNEKCSEAALAGALGAAETGDLSMFSAPIGTLADELRAGPTPSAFEDEVASAADDFERSAEAAAAGDPDGFERHSDDASTTLAAVGVDGC
jgi:hypothetical protein